MSNSIATIRRQAVELGFVIDEEGSTAELHVMSCEEGFYIGTQDEFGHPKTRESACYYPKFGEANDALVTGTWPLNHHGDLIDQLFASVGLDVESFTTGAHH